VAQSQDHNISWYNLPVWRVLRLVRNAIFVLSLLLCAASVILWVRSYNKSEKYLNLTPKLPFDAKDSMHRVSVETGQWFEADSYRGHLFFLRLSNFKIIDHGPSTDEPEIKTIPADLINVKIPASRYSFEWRTTRLHIDVREDTHSLMDSIHLQAPIFQRELNCEYLEGRLDGPFLFRMWHKTGAPSVDPPPPPPEMLPRFQLVIIPHWAATIFFSIVPLLMCASWLRSRHRCNVRRRGGLCIVCGYDLRATRERCPECGAQSQSRN